MTVEDNKPVKAGEVLLRIDPRDYQAKVDQAKAAVAVAAASFQAVRSETQLTRETTQAQGEEAAAALEAARVAEQTAEAAVDESRGAARVATRGAGRHHRRGRRLAQQRRAGRPREGALPKLVESGYVSQREFDQIGGGRCGGGAALEAIQRRVTQAEREVQQVEAELAGRGFAVKQARQRVIELRATLSRAESQRHQVTVKEAEIGRAEATLTQSKADLALAELQLSYTDVQAPIDGLDLAQERGARADGAGRDSRSSRSSRCTTCGCSRTSRRPSSAACARACRPAVEIDTFPGKVFNGKVDSISAGTGARFSLLPPENATGNWVKVVQRIPVKIRLDAKEFGNPHTLRAGMSAVVTVRVK